MAESTPITVRIDNDARDRAQGILETLGLPLSTYLNMAVHQLANQGTVPFEIVPNARAAEVAAAANRIKRSQAKSDWGGARAEAPNPLAETAALLKDALAEGDAGDRDRAYGMIWELAEAIVPKAASSSWQRFYEEGTRGILAAAMAYLCANAEDPGIADTVKALSDAQAVEDIVRWTSEGAKGDKQLFRCLHDLEAGGDAYLMEFARLAAEAVGGPKR